MASIRAAFQLQNCFWVGIAVCGIAAGPVTQREHHTRLPALSIPFSPNIPGSRIRDVELYSSTDGRTWTYVTQAQLSARSEDNRFRHTLQQDGTYYFAVRSIDQANTAHPQGLNELQAGLVVHLDRRAPIVQLRSATPTRPDVVGVEWDIREEHFDASRFHLEYRVPGQSDWAPHQPAEGKITSVGAQYFHFTGAPKIEVRLRVADRAGNEAETSIVVAPGANNGATSSSSGGGNDPVNTNNDSNNRTARPGVSFINSLQLGIPFRISNVGVSGVPVTDLWVTKDDGRTWQKEPRSNDDSPNSLPATPGDNEGLTKRFAYNAPQEGRYGFTVVVRSGVGIGDADPRPGDRPSRLVEVDITKPEIEVRVQRGAGADVRNVTIEWNSKDKNINDRPVSLLWSKAKEGAEWEPIITDLDSKGRYVWTISDQGPFQFYVQARAVDRAGNIGAATHPELITVDLNRPKAEMIDIVPLDKKK